MTRSEPRDRAARTARAVRLRDCGYDHTVVQGLVTEAQQVYVDRYGGPDETPLAAGQFAAPHGRFVVAYLDGEPAAIGGWRLRVGDDASRLPGRRPAEIKRMFVRAQLRGQGLARAVLAYLESTAAAAGVDQMVLETGRRQPEAIALYQSSGYVPIAGFGIYAEEPGIVNLGKPLQPAGHSRDPA